MNQRVIRLIQKKETDQSQSLHVGIPGFEPGTSNSRSWRANRTALHPEQSCLLLNPSTKTKLAEYQRVIVGIPGFEPGTPCSQSRCANRTALHPVVMNSRCKDIEKKSIDQIFYLLFFSIFDYWSVILSVVMVYYPSHYSKFALSWHSLCDR